MVMRHGLIAGMILGVLASGCRNTVPPTLTEKQAALASSVVEASMAAAAAFAGIHPAADLTSFLEGFGDTVPTCPTVQSSTEDDLVTVTLAYGLGCSPALYPDTMLRGSVSGSIELTARTVSLTFEDFGMEGLIDGTLSAAFARQEDILSFDGLIDLDSGGMGTIGGSMVMQIDRTTGEITVLTATLSITDDAGNEFEAMFDDLAVDPAANGNFIPNSGLAVVQVEQSGDDPVTLTIEFTERSPSDATVVVSVSDGPQLIYSFGL